MDFAWFSANAERESPDDMAGTSLGSLIFFGKQFPCSLCVFDRNSLHKTREVLCHFLNRLKQARSTYVRGAARRSTPFATSSKLAIGCFAPAGSESRRGSPCSIQNEPLACSLRNFSLHTAANHGWEAD